MLESSEDSTRELTDAPSGEREEPKELSAGTRNQELLEDSSETERNAKSWQDQVSERSDAEVWLEEELSEDSQDKVKDASLTEEVTTDGLDAHGARTSEELESSEDSTEDTSDVQSGEEEEALKPSAGALEPESSEDSLEGEEDALSGLRLEEDGPDAPEEEFPVKS